MVIKVWSTLTIKKKNGNGNKAVFLMSYSFSVRHVQVQMEQTPYPSLHLIWQQIKFLKPQENSVRLRIKVERPGSVPVFTFVCASE